MILREMTVDDLDQVMVLEEKLFHVPWTREGFFTFLIREDTLFLAVEEKGKILGYAGCLIVLDEADILNIGVDPDRQREGTGGFILQSLLRLLQMQGVHYVHLEVRESNGTARRLYERNGFAIDGLRKDYYTDPTENAVLMTKTLNGR